MSWVTRSGSRISVSLDENCSLIVDEITLGPEVEQPTAAAAQVGLASMKPELPGSPVNNDVGVITNAPNDSQRTWKVYNGWVNSVMEEYVNIHTTRSSDEMGYVTYFEDGSMYKVDNPRYIHNPNGDCWVDDPSWWIIQRCDVQIWDESPAQVRFESWGEFHSGLPPRPDYTHHNMYNQWAGFWAYDCSLSQGKRPYGWNFICEGGRKLTATKN